MRRPETETGERQAENGCRIAARRRNGPAFGLALRAPLPRRIGMRRAGWVFPKNREDEPRTQRSQPSGCDLPPSLQTSEETGTSFGCGLDAKIAAVEYEMIVEALKTHKGNMTKAAEELGLTRRMLGLRMERYNLSYKPFRRE